MTGLRPDRHGLVNNTMEDARFPGAVFKLSDRAENSQPRWWDEGEPLWVTAERAGVRTATMFWPGSEVAIRGVRPSQWRTFDQAMTSAARVDTLLTWLDAPPQARPRFLTLYFDIVDTAGHRSGPDSAQVNAAVAEVDAALARLLDGLAARGLADANLVIVSDHGMAQVSADRVVDLDALVPPADVRIPWMGGAFAGIEPAPGRREAVEAALLGRRGRMECWRKGELPARFAFGAHPRVPPIFCLADTGWLIVSASRPSAYTSVGVHGFDTAAPEMAALFVAHGPAFRRGAVLPAFDNVHVYPLLARLVGVAPLSGDGDPDRLAAALR